MTLDFITAYGLRLENLSNFGKLQLFLSIIEVLIEQGASPTGCGKGGPAVRVLRDILTQTK